METTKQIQDVNLDAKDIHDNICIDVIVSKKKSCFICNLTIEELPEKGDCYNCATELLQHFTENYNEDQTGVYLSNAIGR